MNKDFIKNIFKVLCGNVMIIISGIVTGFLLPKILGVTDYGFYKIFNLYTTYVVFFDLGIANGVYLVFGGYKLDDLPKEKMRLYFRLLFIIQCIALAILQFVAVALMKDEYTFIFSMIGLYLLANNITNYFEKVSVMSGEFNALVRRDILKSIMSVTIMALLYLAIKLDIPIQHFEIYTILFVGVYFLLAIQYVGIYKNLIFGKAAKFTDEISNIAHIIKIGLLLVFADMVANLILTLDRQFVSVLFDVDTYSIYSFAYSLLKVVTLAISAISSVLYPTLKRMSISEMRRSYGLSVSIVGMIAFICLLGYYPLCLVVDWFLPNYVESLPIFRVLFPSITINSIISMVMINHYKALQKQNLYFVISLTVLGLSTALNFGAYMLIGVPVGFSIASVITMMVWYCISDIYLGKKYKIKTKKYFLYLIANTFIFYMLTKFIKNYYLGFFINAFCIVVLSMVFYKYEWNLLVKKLVKKNNHI